MAGTLRAQLRANSEQWIVDGPKTADAPIHCPSPEQRALRQEYANAVTHAIGLVLSVAGSAYLMVECVRTGQVWLVNSCAVYVTTLIMVYAFSMLSHAVHQPQLKRTFRILDQGSIYLHIPAGFTPFALAYLSLGNVWMLLTVMWGVAVWGCCTKLLRAHQLESVSISTYVLLGWLPLTMSQTALATVPATALMLAVGGGICFTIGTVFLALDRRVPYFHTLWHLWVITGSVCHYMVILGYIVPQAT